MALIITKLPAIYYLKALLGETYEIERFAKDRNVLLDVLMAKVNEEIAAVVRGSGVEEDLMAEEMKLIEHAYRVVLSPSYHPIYEDIRNMILKERANMQKIREAIKSLKKYCIEAGIPITKVAVYDLVATQN